MSSGLRVRLANEGGKHVTAVISGWLTGDSSISILDAATFNPRPKSLYLTEVTFSLQDKLGVQLLWGMEGEKEAELILPLESRGKFDFSGFRGLPSPKENWGQKIILRTFNFSQPPASERKALLIVLHLEKGNG